MSKVKDEGESKRKEAVYDAEINPLVTAIIEVCKRERISLIADFGLDEDLHSTTALLTEEHSPSQAQLMACKILMEG